MSRFSHILSACLTAVCIPAAAFPGGDMAPDRDTLPVRTYSIDSSCVSATLPIFKSGSSFMYTPDRASSVVSVIGEPDVVRQTATLPGVSAGIEGSLGLFVRGGNAGSARIEYGGVPVYGSSHCIGLFSAFSPDIISYTDFRTGGYGASSGNFTSSLMRIWRKSGPLERVSGNFSVSPYMLSGYMEGPSRGRNSSFRAGVRFSPLPLMAGAVTSASDDMDGVNGNIFDASIAAEFLNPRRPGQVTEISAVMSMDRLNVTSEEECSTVRNALGLVSASHKTPVGNKSGLDLLAYASFASVKEIQEYEISSGSSRFSRSSTIRDIGFRAAATHRVSGQFTLSEGFEAKALCGAFTPAVFVEAGYTGKRMMLSGGLRQTLHLYRSRAITGTDVHLKADFLFRNSSGMEISFDRTTQYLHQLEGLPTGWALDITVPASADFPEETSDMIYAGCFKELSIDGGYLGGTTLHFNLGGYLRRLDGIVSYTSGVNMFRLMDDTWESDVESGTGRSAGLEFAASMSSPRLSANVAYTFSRTDRKFPTINEGERFPFKFDRPHVFNLQADWTAVKGIRKSGVGKEHHLSAVISASSGNRMTIYRSQYMGMLPPYWNTSMYDHYTDEYQDNIYERYEMSGINAHQLRPYFRLDLSYSFRFIRPRCTHGLSISVFNVTNRHNPYIIYNDYGQWKQISILPILPCIRWDVEF